MPNLKDIKRRIKSIQNTQKITQAMKMVAAAKVRRAETKVKSARPYSKKIAGALSVLLSKKPEIRDTKIITQRAMDNYPALLEHREMKTVGLLLITSDRGLAGGYNTNLVRAANKRIRELKQSNVDVKLYIVGLKGISALKRKEDIDIVKTYSRMPAVPSVHEADLIAEDLAEAFVEEEIDSIELITTNFKTMMSFDVQSWKILPVLLPSQPEEYESSSEMIFEPSPEAVLQKIVPLYLSNRVYQALLEASASELASRMAAMSAATKNASEVIQQLTVVYNKARQASITQEILEVVSGANALNN